MLSAILIILALPLVDLGRSRGLQFRPLSKIAFYIFVTNFLILKQLGAKHVEVPFILLGQTCTVLYFVHFLIIIPFLSLLENTLVDLNIRSNSRINYNLSLNT
jgi:ubiquinol-cytochrome c reductase cytochrome b subunit